MAFIPKISLFLPFLFATASYAEPTTPPNPSYDEELTEQDAWALALKDLGRKLERDLEAIKSELARLRQKDFVRSEVTHLLDEELFFSEQNFVRGGPSRNTKSDSSAFGSAMVESSGTLSPPPLSPPTNYSEKLLLPTVIPESQLLSLKEQETMLKLGAELGIDLKPLYQVNPGTRPMDSLKKRETATENLIKRIGELERVKAHPHP